MPMSAFSEARELTLSASSCRSWAAASWRAEGEGVALNVNSSGAPIFDCPYRPNSAAEQRRHPKWRSPGRSLIGTTPANGSIRGWRIHCTETSCAGGPAKRSAPTIRSAGRQSLQASATAPALRHRGIRCRSCAGTRASTCRVETGFDSWAWCAPGDCEDTNLSTHSLTT
jgi:hypothetical protein